MTVEGSATMIGRQDRAWAQAIRALKPEEWEKFEAARRIVQDGLPAEPEPELHVSAHEELTDYLCRHLPERLTGRMVAELRHALGLTQRMFLAYGNLVAATMYAWEADPKCRLSPRSTRRFLAAVAERLLAAQRMARWREWCERRRGAA